MNLDDSIRKSAKNPGLLHPIELWLVILLSPNSLDFKEKRRGQYFASPLLTKSRVKWNVHV